MITKKNRQSSKKKQVSDVQTNQTDTVLGGQNRIYSVWGEIPSFQNSSSGKMSKQKMILLPKKWWESNAL